MNPNDPKNRFYFAPAYRVGVCCSCAHYISGVKCKAYPDGIPRDVLLGKEKERNNADVKENSCNGVDDIHFEPKEP